MLTIDALRAWGANVDEGLKRCMNNEAFYLRLVKMAADDGGFARLEESIRAGDPAAAFDAAHALKGMLGNLALTPIFQPVSELTELFRHRAAGDYQSLLDTVLREQAALKAIAE